jgi:tetratricopeptide (TPR) repeat protein
MIPNAQYQPKPNDPCPCRSGKRFKHCCANTAVTAELQQANVDVVRLLETARMHAYQAGNFAAAEQCFRMVLQQKPNNAEALAGVGQALCWRNRRAEGRVYLAKAGKQLLRQLTKVDARLLVQLAEQLQVWGEIELAVQLCRAATQTMPKNPSAHYALGACLQRLNRSDLALTSLQKVLKILPEDSGTHTLIAVIEFDKKQYDAAQQRLEQVVKRETQSAPLARACLELAKVYDKQRRYDEAFAVLQRSMALARQAPEAQRIDGEYLFQRVAQFKQGYDAALLQRWQAQDFDDGYPFPVFLIGFLRSGTTLTEQVLSAHPAVLTSDENNLINEVVGELEQITNIKGDTPQALRVLTLPQARQLRAFYWQRSVEEFGANVLKQCFVNKVALNSIETGLISVLFPEARILFALRDPRDVCLSCAMQAFSLTPATVNLLSWQGIARQYAAVMDLWLHLRAQIAPRYLELRYEDTVGDFTATFQRVFALLDLHWDARVEQFYQNSAGKFIATPSFTAVSQPLYQSSVARWRGYSAHFNAVDEWLSPYIQAFGYEQ